jgi:acyl-CoA synthetase (AMP-forming)/AMP-acid ligase II
VVVAGDHLMVGYLGQPEQTAALRFGPWQRTGDIGRIDRDGFVYLTDRKNDLIITGGSNVYPRDVEEALYAHPAVREAVAIGIPDERWGETVRALVVLRSGCTVSSDELMQWCKQHLASYKRPRSVEFVDDLPKNAYGKILRRAIRQRYWSQV